MPAGRNSSGLWPAEASRPIAPETCESTIQKSPCGVDSTCGARSRSRAGARDVHRSFGGFTCESAEMMRSFVMGRSPLESINRPGSAGPPGSGRDAGHQRGERLAAAAGGVQDGGGEGGGDLVPLLCRADDAGDHLQLLGGHLERLQSRLPVAGRLGRRELRARLADRLAQLGRGRGRQVRDARAVDRRVHGVQAAGHGGEARLRIVAAPGGGADVLGAEIAVVTCLVRDAEIRTPGLARVVEPAYPAEVGLSVVAVERRDRDAHARRAAGTAVAASDHVAVGVDAARRAQCERVDERIGAEVGVGVAGVARAVVVVVALAVVVAAARDRLVHAARGRVAEVLRADVGVGGAGERGPGYAAPALAVVGRVTGVAARGPVGGVRVLALGGDARAGLAGHLALAVRVGGAAAVDDAAAVVDAGGADVAAGAVARRAAAAGDGDATLEGVAAVRAGWGVVAIERRPGHAYAGLTRLHSVADVAVAARRAVRQRRDRARVIPATTGIRRARIAVVAVGGGVAGLGDAAPRGIADLPGGTRDQGAVVAADELCTGRRAVAGVAVVRADDRRVCAARARIAGVVRAHVAIIAVGRGPAGAETVRAGVAGRAGVRVVARAPVGHRLVDAAEHGIAAVRSAGVGIVPGQRRDRVVAAVARYGPTAHVVAAAARAGRGRGRDEEGAADQTREEGSHRRGPWSNGCARSGNRAARKGPRPC